MKVIDLLNKIANGEEVPKQVKFGNVIYQYNENLVQEHLRYYSTSSKYLLYSAYLSDEVEIIEDDKKIDTVDIAWQNVFDEQAQQDCVKIILNKINEIIDKINKMED